MAPKYFIQKLLPIIQMFIKYYSKIKFTIDSSF